MNQKNAFTLIEMLVVIAMIGILSTVLLVAINPSRTKANDAKVISYLNQIVALGQRYYSPLDGGYNMPEFVTSTEYKDLAKYIGTEGGSGLTVYPSNTVTSTFAVTVKLPSGDYMCRDSEGNVKKSSNSITPTNNKCN
jgi:prepilin-type N-terminal cleavage/methylation domain-containing protein